MFADIQQRRAAVCSRCSVWLSLPGFVFGLQDTNALSAGTMRRIRTPGVVCASQAECPHAELSSATGALINRAPFRATSGTALAISSAANNMTQQVAFELFTYMAARSQYTHPCSTAPEEKRLRSRARC